YRSQSLDRRIAIAIDNMEMHKTLKGRAPKISQDLILFGSQHDLFLLDPKSNLSIQSSLRNVVCKGDPRRARYLDSNDRLNMVEGIERYYLHDEKLIPQTPLPNAPLI
ncbi:4462_t:CDS:2, partial [Racocetra fulgida]